MTRRHLVVVSLSFLIMWAIFFFPVLTGYHVFFSHDIMTFYYPYRAYAAARLVEGDIPLWSSLSSCGFPVHAVGEIGVLYPPNLVMYRLFEPLRAFSLGLIGHYLLAGIGMIVLQYGRRRGPWETFLSAVVFTFSGFMITHLMHTSIINAAVWLPWLFVCLHRWKQDGLWRWLVLAGGVSALQFLAAHPQIGVMSLVAGCLWIVINTARADTFSKTFSRGLLACVLLVMITYSVAAVQLIPLFETVVHSTRGVGPAAALRSQGALPPVMLLNLLFPDFFGRTRPADVSGYGFVSPHSWGPGSAYWEMCGYVGSLTLLMVAIGMIACPRRADDLFYVILAIISLIMALGNAGLLYHLFQFFPGAERLRFPSRFLLLWSFAAALLAGDGLRHLHTSPAASRAVKLTMRIAIVICLLTLVMAPLINAFVVKNRDYLENRGRQWIETSLMNKPGHRLTQERYQQKLTRTIRGVIHSTDLQHNVVTRPLGFLAVGILLAMLAMRHGVKTQRKVMIVPLLVGLVVIDLSTFGHGYNATTGPAFFEKPESASILSADTDIFRFLSLDRRGMQERELLKPAFNVLFDIPSLFTPGPFMTRGLHDWFKVTGTGLAPFDKEVRKQMVLENLPLIGLMNVKYILTTSLIEDERLELVHDRTVKIYRNHTVMPRAHLVGQADLLPASMRDDIATYLTENTSRPRYVVALDRGDEQVNTDAMPARASDEEPPTSQSPGSIISAHHAEHHLDLEVSVSQKCWLRITDAWYPGWCARIDSHIAPVLVADGLFRALELTPGNHSITLDYRPWSFMAGLFGSLLTLAFIAGAFVTGGFKL